MRLLQQTEMKMMSENGKKFSKMQNEKIFYSS